LLHIKITSPLTKNVQNCCLTVSVAISLRQNWCQSNRHVSWSDKHNPSFRGPPGDCCGKSGATNLKGRLINFLSKSEYLSSRICLSCTVPTHVTSLDAMAVNLSSFVSMRKRTSDFFVLGYLRTLFQLGWIGRISRNFVKNCEQLIVLNYTVTT